MDTEKLCYVDARYLRRCLDISMNEVLINHMYSGNYLESGNLGHEVINLFKSDNGNHYTYAMSAGDYDTKSHVNSMFLWNTVSPMLLMTQMYMLL